MAGWHPQPYDRSEEPSGKALQERLAFTEAEQASSEDNEITHAGGFVPRVSEPNAEVSRLYGVMNGLLNELDVAAEHDIQCPHCNSLFRQPKAPARLEVFTELARILCRRRGQ